MSIKIWGETIDGKGRTWFISVVVKGDGYWIRLK
mgnify:FL=1